MPVTRSQRGNSPVTQQDTQATEGQGTSSSSSTMDTLTTSYDSQATSVTERTDTTRRKARSVKSTKRQELEARIELARQQLKEAQAASALAKTRLELLQADDEDSEIENEEFNTNVQTWVQSTVERTSGEEHQGEASGEGRQEEVSSKETIHPQITTVKPEDPVSTSKDGTRELAEAIVQAINTAPRNGSTSQPSYVHDLPGFDGSSGEWIAFRTVYEDTAPLFSEAQNMARLRRSIKGLAREAIKSLLFSESSPKEVMEALRRRFGRPEALILTELEKVKSLPRINENARDVCVFASQVNNTVATIRGLRKPQYLHSPEMVKQIVDKMPAVLRYRWYDFAADKEDADPDLVSLMQFLNREADRCGPYATQEAVPARPPPRRQFAHAATHAAFEQSKERKPSCPHCQREHHLYECREFSKMPMNERWDIAIKSRLCFRCLHGRHRKETCRRPPCKVCKRWHHSLLHDEGKEEPKQDVKKEIANNVMLPVNTVQTSKAYLKMVPVELYGPKGTARILALLDEGSTVTLLDSTVARQVGLKGPIEALTLETVGGKTITKEDSMKLNMKIRGIHQIKKRTLSGARTIDDISLTPQKLEKSRIRDCAHLKHMVEQLYYEEESPKLLIGQDNWELIVSRATRKGKRRHPVASLTYLGWVLHGSDGIASRTVNFVTCAHICTKEDELERIVKEHFAVESLGVQPRRPTTDIAEKALNTLKNTTRRLQNGRFETGLLWKNDNDKMPDNYKQAVSRLKNIEKKLDNDTKLKQEYEAQIRNLLDKGYAEEVQHGSASERTWYLPHFAVTHPTKGKIRLVFDAAAKYQGTSLNDMLLQGPDLLQSLFGVLLRFREKPVAVVADIKEMFLQIRIREQDRDSLRFLWRGGHRSGVPREYRMTSVIFGAACSPSAAIFVKNENALEQQNEFPEAARAIERNHYMDDYLHSFETGDEAVKIASEVNIVHRKAGFELRGWASNDGRVLRKLTLDRSNTEVELGTKEEKTLGLRWFTESDEIGFRSNLRNIHNDVVGMKRTPTKREVTSAVMSTFDPLGLASPVLIQGKKLIQSIWRSGVGWDDHITGEDNKTWGEYLKNLELLKTLRAPRCIAQSNTEGELHTFVDASEEAYACAVYLRQRSTGGHRVTLIAGKARVTPLKPVSIPRLELQAALLGTRLARSVEEELDIKIQKKTYWSDSTTVLSWIKSDPRTFKTFVAHRLAEIEDTTRPQEWRWVPTALNPADDATRNIPRDFGGEHRWFVGPEFLMRDEEQWPRPRRFETRHSGEEKDKTTVANIKIADKYATPEPTKFSSWTRLVRATARVLQFIDLCRKRKERVNISRKVERQDPTWRRNKKRKEVKTKFVRTKTQERGSLPLEPCFIKEAERILMRRSQEESFKREIECLKKSKRLETDSKLRNLDVAMTEGLLRIRGRIAAATAIEEDYKKPVVLDSKQYIAKLIITHYHVLFNHGNHATVINELRQRYWILGLRSAVRSTVHQCQWCRVYRGTPQHQPIGDLPKERLQHGKPPFTCSAVDYFGPMSVTVGRRHEKRWGALFTCLTTRAVHIELAASLTIDSMISALRRMAARRGMPRTIFSDNGTNFVGANKELQEARASFKQEEFATEAEKIGVRWKFIPPGAPNMGGAWERLVRSIKTALAVTLKERHPQEEVLHTLLLEAEHLVNSRPLIEANEDSPEEALTPNHFLIGRSCGSARLGALTNDDLVGRRTWRLAQRLADHFWSRWVKEYLPTLVPRRSDARRPARELQRGDIVLVVDSTLPRGIWPRGEVVQTYPGPDGRTRVLEVRTPGGIMKRPSSKLVLLVSAQRVDEPADIESTNEPDCGQAVTTSEREHRVAGSGAGAAHEGEDVGDRDTSKLSN